MTPHSLQKEFKAKIYSAKDLLDMVEEFMAGVGSIGDTMKIQTAAEEYFINIVKHGYKDMEPGTIIVKLDKIDSTMIMTFVDTGHEFDPASIPTPETPESVEKAKIGGQGIVIIREFMDEIEYHREDGKNHFTMKKHLKNDPLHNQEEDI